MLKRTLLAGLLVAVFGCEKKEEAPPTTQERAAAESAKREATALEAAKERQERAEKVAEERTDVAEDMAEAAKEKADEAADEIDDKVAKDWRGPDESWDREWTTFASGEERNYDRGDYTIERGREGEISAWRKTKQVAGGAFAEVKDAALVAQVKAKLAADDDLKATQINVDAEDHVVRLRGTVDSPQLAARAVRMALGTPGAEKVVSHLTWQRK